MKITSFFASKGTITSTSKNLPLKNQDSSDSNQQGLSSTKRQRDEHDHVTQLKKNENAPWFSRVI